MTAKIMAYEAGEMDFNEMVEFFQELIDTGTIGHLQGHYQRQAQSLFADGFVTLPVFLRG